jgi:arylsulfatase A-like enzyme
MNYNLNVTAFVFISFIFNLFVLNKVMANDRAPNIILIVADDLGWRDLGCYGNTLVETPTIDKLAKEGMLFTQAYASAALCSPTRAALLTGKSPARLGLTNRIAWWRPPETEKKFVEHEGQDLKTPVNMPYLPTSETTLPEQLKELGYSCAHIGKWHLGGEGHLPLDHGFDLNIGGNHRGDIPSYFAPFHGDTEGIKEFFPEAHPGEYLTDYETRMATRFIKENADKKFFLNLWHYAVHTPIEAKKEVVEKYREQKNAGERSAYYAMVEHLDHVVNELIKTLEELELMKNTLIFFTSDNGGLAMPYAADNNPLRAGKGYPYEGGLRVPMIVYYPSEIKPDVSNYPVISHDIYPTIMEMLQIKYETATMDGKSFLAKMKEEENSDERTLIWHFPHYRENQYTVFGEVEPYSIILKGEYKLIKNYDSNTFELYNLKKDLGEENNLAKILPLMVNDLNRELLHILDSIDANCMKR